MAFHQDNLQNQNNANEFQSYDKGVLWTASPGLIKGKKDISDRINSQGERIYQDYFGDFFPEGYFEVYFPFEDYFFRK